MKLTGKHGCLKRTCHSPSHQLPQTPWNETSRRCPFIFLCKLVNGEAMFIQQKWRMATIDFIAAALSGKLFERYDYDEYQK